MLQAGGGAQQGQVQAQPQVPQGPGAAGPSRPVQQQGKDGKGKKICFDYHSELRQSQQRLVVPPHFKWQRDHG
jgi:hypothetical protein